ncbi:Hypothetical predicted protein, partial [Pelobates cultripes]
SLDLMLIIIQDVKTDMLEVNQKILSLESEHAVLLTPPEGEQLKQKLKEELLNYKNELVRFKQQKFESVYLDYQEHRVYKWLTGDNQRKPRRQGK